MDALTETLVPGLTRSAIHPTAIVAPDAELGAHSRCALPAKERTSRSLI